MKKKIISTSLAILTAMAFAACGSKEAEESSPEETMENELSDKTGSEKETEEEAQLIKEPEFTVLSTTIETEDTYTPTEEYTDGEPFAYGRVTYPGIEPTDAMRNTYPELSETLRNWSDEREEEAMEILAEAWTMGAEMAANENAYFLGTNYHECTPTVLRADDQAVSILLEYNAFYNGPHPSAWYGSYFIDTQSGEFLPLSDVVNDMFALPEAIWENLENIDGEYDFTDDRDTIFPVIEEYVSDGNLVWTMDKEGFHVYFDAYDLMWYAFGPIFADLSFEDYPDLFVEKYIPTGDGTPLDTRISYSSAEGDNYTYEELEPYGATTDWEDYDADGESDIFLIECPAWDATYQADGIFDTLTESLMILTQEDEESSDWLDATAWSARTGIALPENLYSGEGLADDDYWYYTDNTISDSLRLEVYKYTGGGDYTVYDFSEYLNTPAPGNAFTTLEIPYAQIVNGVLYVEIAHRTYSADQPYTGFIVAVEADTGKLLWRSDMLVANGHNFLVIDDYIVCGYGFTDEPDYLYILSKESGAVLEKRLINSAPDHFILDENGIADWKLYVITYDTAYTFGVSFG